MQNPDTVDLPFAQQYANSVAYPIHTEQPTIPINFGFNQSFKRPRPADAQSKLATTRRFPRFESITLASLSRGRRIYYNYIVNGYHWTFGKMVNKKVRWTESNAQQYRAKGYSVVKVKDTGDILLPKPKPKPKPSIPTDKHGHVFETVHPKQTRQLVKMGFDLTDLGNKLTDALKHRTSIEGKVETIITQRQDISSKLKKLGTSVTDVSSALEAHKLGHNGFNPFGDIPMWVALGALAFFVVLKK